MKAILLSKLKKGDYFKSSLVKGMPLKRITKVCKKLGMVYYEMYAYTGLSCSINDVVYVYETGLFAPNSLKDEK